MNVHRTEGQPHDELTELAAEMLELVDDETRAIVMVGNSDRMAVAYHAYDDDVEAITDLILHLRAVLQSTGRDLAIIPAGKRGYG